MKTGTLRAVAVACSLSAIVAFSAGCASTGRDGQTRDDIVRERLTGSLGLEGRLRTVHLGQSSSTRLRAAATRLDGDLMLLQDVHQRISVLDRNRMMPRWEYHGIDDPLRYAPTTNEISVVAMAGNRLYQVDRTYGHAQGGAVHFDITPSAPFVATAGTAFVPTWGGGRGKKTLSTINLVTGLLGWGYRTEGDIRSAMALGGDSPRQVVYFATDIGTVYAIPAVGADSDAPEPNWMHRCRGGITADLHLSGENLFVSCQDSAVYCLDRITGAVRWATYLDAALTENAVATATSVYQWTSGGLHCLDRATGERRWTIADGRRFIVEREGKTVIQAANGTLRVLRADGSVVVSAAPGAYAYLTNTMDDTLYAVAEDGYIASLEVGGE